MLVRLPARLETRLTINLLDGAGGALLVLQGPA